MSSRIQVYIDPAQIIQPTSGHVLVENISDYVPAYVQIVAALHAGQPLTIIVRHRACAVWLQEAREKYGQERIQIETISYRSRLAELWGVEVPTWATDEEIARSSLLEVPLRAQPGQRFEDVVLEVFYSPFLTYDRLPLLYLAELLNNYSPEQWAQSDKRPLVREVRMRRLQAWAEVADSVGEQELVEGLKHDPQDLTRRLSQIRVLSGYPNEVGQRVMGPEYDILANMKLDLGGLPVREADLGSVIDQVRVYLNHLALDHAPAEALSLLLDQASGHLVIEFETVSSLLKSNQVMADSELVHRVQRKFSPLSGQLEQELSDLDLLITRPRPSQPDPAKDWTADQWLDWAVQQYLPYRFWLEEVGRHDAELTVQADAYAEWLYTSYAQLWTGYSRMVYRSLLNLIDRLKASPPVLIAVLDNFNYKFLPDLQRYLQAQGFAAEQSCPYLVMLPSCTEVSKKCLFIGQPEPFSGTAYKKPTLAAWSGTLGHRRVCYLSGIGDLRAVRQREHDVFFLNYIPIDKALHEDEHQTGISHSAAVRQRLQALAKDIRAFAGRIGAEQELVIIVTSDHGSARIPADAPNLIDRHFYAKKVEDKHHRYVTMSDKALAALPGNVRFECYIFEREKFNLRTNYLAARSTYRFVDPGERLYVHGGLSPEETVVPVTVFTPLMAKAKPLTIRFLVDELRYDVKSFVRLEVVNPNDYPGQEICAEIVTPGVEAVPATLKNLERLGHTEVCIETRVRRADTQTLPLQVRITWQFLGQPQSQLEEAPVRIRRMVTTAFDMEEFAKS